MWSPSLASVSPTAALLRAAVPVTTHHTSKCQEISYRSTECLPTTAIESQKLCLTESNLCGNLWNSTSVICSLVYGGKEKCFQMVSPVI